MSIDGLSQVLRDEVANTVGGGQYPSRVEQHTKDVLQKVPLLFSTRSIVSVSARYRRSLMFGHYWT